MAQQLTELIEQFCSFHLGFRTPRGHAFANDTGRFLYRALQRDPALADLFAFDGSLTTRPLRAKSEQPGEAAWKPKGRQLSPLSYINLVTVLMALVYGTSR